jgi:signal transduction histidine kinase
VTLAAAVADGTVRIKVSDDGEGIAPGDLSSIFDRHPSSSGAAEGTPRHGLGLTIAREIVLQHGGELTAESQPARGSVFTMVLPLDGGE